MIKDVRSAQVRSEVLLYLGPAHQLVDGEELEELGLDRNLSVAGVRLNAVKKVGLLIVVRSEDNVVNDALESLDKSVILRSMTG